MMFLRPGSRQIRRQVLIDLFGFALLGRLRK